MYWIDRGMGYIYSDVFCASVRIIIGEAFLLKSIYLVILEMGLYRLYILYPGFTFHFMSVNLLYMLFLLLTLLLLSFS